MAIKLAVLFAAVLVSVSAGPQNDPTLIGANNQPTGNNNVIGGANIPVIVDLNGNLVDEFGNIYGTVPSNVPFGANGLFIDVNGNLVDGNGNNYGSVLANTAQGNQIIGNVNVLPTDTIIGGVPVNDGNLANGVFLPNTNIRPGSFEALGTLGNILPQETLTDQSIINSILNQLNNNNSNINNNNNNNDISTTTTSILDRLFSGPVSGRPRCARNEIFLACGSRCTRTCGNFLQQTTTCPTGCRPGCFCIDGMVRDEWNGGQCVWPYRCRALRRRPNRNSRSSSEEHNRKKYKRRSNESGRQRVLDLK